MYVWRACTPRAECSVTVHKIYTKYIYKYITEHNKIYPIDVAGRLARLKHALSWASSSVKNIIKMPLGCSVGLFKKCLKKTWNLANDKYLLLTTYVLCTKTSNTWLIPMYDGLKSEEYNFSHFEVCRGRSRWLGVRREKEMA